MDPTGAVCESCGDDRSSTIIGILDSIFGKDGAKSWAGSGELDLTIGTFDSLASRSLADSWNSGPRLYMLETLPRADRVSSVDELTASDDVFIRCFSACHVFIRSSSSACQMSASLNIHIRLIQTWYSFSDVPGAKSG